MSSRKDPFQKLCRSFLCRMHATVSRPWCCSGSNLKDVLLLELCMYLTMCSARRLVTCRYSSTTNPSSECAVPVNLRSSSDNAEFWRPTEHCWVCLVLDQVAWHALTHGQPSNNPTERLMYRMHAVPCSGPRCLTCLDAWTAKYYVWTQQCALCI